MLNHVTCCLFLDFSLKMTIIKKLRQFGALCIYSKLFLSNHQPCLCKKKKKKIHLYAQINKNEFEMPMENPTYGLVRNLLRVVLSVRWPKLSSVFQNFTSITITENLWKYFDLIIIRSEICTINGEVQFHPSGRARQTTHKHGWCLDCKGFE